MMTTPSGAYVNHPCSGKCYTLPADFDKAQESKDDVVKISLAEKLRKDVFEIELKPLESRMTHNCVSLPCGYPVYGCSCGQKDVVVLLRYVPSRSEIKHWWPMSPIVYKVQYFPEIWISGNHTQVCLSKVGKTLEEIYEAETLVKTEAVAAASEVVELSPAKNSCVIDLTEYLDYDFPVALKGVRGKCGKRRPFKKSPKRGKDKSDNHHVDVRVSDPLPISKSDYLFWDDVIGQTYNYSCGCGFEYEIRLKSAQMAFNSDFKCSICGLISDLANSILIKYNRDIEDCLWKDNCYCDYCNNYGYYGHSYDSYSDNYSNYTDWTW